MRVHYVFAAVLFFCVCLTNPAAGGESRTLYDSSASFSGWDAAAEDGSAAVSTGEIPHADAVGLRVRIPSSGRTALTVEPEGVKRDWTGWKRLKMRFFWAEGRPQDVDIGVFVEDRYLNRYVHSVEGPAETSAESTAVVQLSADAGGWRPQGHSVPWDGYCPQEIRRVGLTVSSSGSDVGRRTFLVDRVELVGEKSSADRENAIEHLRQNVRDVGLYGKFELSFGLRRAYSNPFDPNTVSVEGVFIRPDGEKVRVPGFFYQGYRRELEGQREVLTPRGGRHWKIRYAPRQTGVYHYYVEVRDGDLLRSPIKAFEVVRNNRSGKPRGFVRVSEQDADYFEFTGGESFYPIGHNIAAPQNFRPDALPGSMAPRQDTYTYDRLLSTMADSGENFGRVWMVPPGFELEWSRAYSPHYHGPGRYNLRKAWQLDHVVEKAAKEGVYLLLLITSRRELEDFGAYFGAEDGGRGGFPYAEQNGGPLSGPKEFFTSDEAWELYRRKLRYIVARWGYATSIMGWELLDEPDRLDFYRNSYTFGRQAAEFVEAAASHMERESPGQHLFTSNCHYYRSEVAAPVLSLDEVDFTTGHIYASDLEGRLASARRYMEQRYDKIFLATEAGVTPFAQDPELTERTIHRMLWASHMMPLAGTAMPWWWNFVDGQGLYGQFAAVRSFAADQERRGAGFRSISSSVSPAKGSRSLEIRTLKAEGRARCWIYEPAAFKPRAEWQQSRQSGAEVSIPGMSPGIYIIEIWDTRRGEVIEEKEVLLKGDQQPLSFTVPSFSRDIAVKALRQGEAD